MLTARTPHGIAIGTAGAANNVQEFLGSRLDISNNPTYVEEFVYICSQIT